MFWGLIMEPGKKYSQIVEKDFHIAQAALDLDSALDSPVQVLISIDGRNYLVCTLIKNKICQANLDLNFRAGVKVSFATNGPGHVHLTGYLIPEETEYEFEDSDEEVEEEETVKEEVSKKRKAQQQKENKSTKKSKPALLLEQLDDENYNEDEDSDVNLTDLMDDSDDDSDDDDEEEEAEHEEASDDDDDSAEEEESSEEEVKVVQKKSPQKHESPKQNGMTKKTPKHEKNQKLDKTPKGGDKTPKGGDKTPKGGDKTPKGGDKTPKSGDKSLKEKTPKGPKTPMSQEKSPKNEQKQKTPKGNKSPGGDSNSPVKKVVEGGVFIEDLKVGEGRVAKPGNNIRVYYEGRLGPNNKIFDSSTKGPGFKFRLGKQEVIKGWDVGVAGMKIGGKRRIICPPHMAYGAGGSPPVIPPNATLIFDVELKHIH